MPAEPLAVTLSVIEAFEKLNVSYLIGGSLASALHGTARSTLDADLVADLRSEQVKPLVEILQHDFYIDREAILDAIQHQSSFNIIHLETAFKVDIFIAKPRRFDRMQFQRRRLEVVANDPERIQAGRLDLDYLQEWAVELGVADLLQRASKESE
ncbi:MAG: hypothetical protein P8X95_14595 [Anaerolineales bacterium]